MSPTILAERVAFFVVLFQGRVGSSWLIEALNSNPQIEAFGEKLASLHCEGPLAQNLWLKHYFADRPDAESVRGFKTKLSDVIDVHEFSSQLIQNHCVVILLDRINLVKQALSWLRADELFQRRGVHNIHQLSDRLSPSHINAEELLKRTVLLDRGRSDLNRFVDELKLPTLHICYEDLLHNADSVFEVVQRFLRTQTRTLTYSIVKATSDPLAAAISNLDEVMEVFCETAYFHMLSDNLDFK